MDLYRFYFSLEKDCAARKAVPKLFNAVYPRFEKDNLSFEERKEMEATMFFSRKELEGIIQKNLIREILKCTCGICKSHPPPPAIDFEDVVGEIKRRGKITLALLVYLCRPCMIQDWIKTSTSIEDGN